MTTKDKIIFESLKLFSVDGYESVSTRMIAKAVGASDSVIYKHFKSKSEILDCIVEICRHRLIERRSQFSIEKIDWAAVEKMCIDMFRFQTTDEWIVPFRKLLVIEQFKNQELHDLYKNFFIDYPLDSTAELFSHLIEQGWMKKGNPVVYAMELYSPFFLYHTLAPVTDETIANLEEHVRNFRLSVASESRKKFIMKTSDFLSKK